MRVMWVVALAACGGPAAQEPLANARSRSGDPRCEFQPVGPSVAPVMFEHGYVISDAELLRRAIRPHTDQLTRCYSERAQQDASLYGRVTATIRIDDEGRATKVSMHGFDEAIDVCLCEVLLGIDYARLRGRDVTLPLMFSARR